MLQGSGAVWCGVVGSVEMNPSRWAWLGIGVAGLDCRSGKSDGVDSIQVAGRI